MKKFYLLIFLVAASLLSNAQQLPAYKWSKGMGGNGTDESADMDVDRNGNTVVVGKFGSTCNFNPNGTTNRTSSGISDIFIAKYDVDGALLWVKTLGGPTQDFASAVKVDGSGNIYVLADFYDSIDYNPGAVGQHTFVGQSGLSDVIMLKYDSTGAFQWAKQLGGTSIDRSDDLDLDATNNIYITCSFYGTVDYDPSATGVASFTTLGTSDIVIAKYDSNGNYIWAKQIGGAGFQTARTINVDEFNNAIISGSFTNSPDFDPGAGVDSIPNNTQYGYIGYLAKYDSNGNYMWSKGIVQSTGGFITLNNHTTDNLGNIYVTGNFTFPTDFDPDTSSFILTAPGGNRFIFFAKYNVNGALVWAKNIDHPNLGGQDEGISIEVDAQYNIYLTGKFWGQGCDFDPDPSVTFTLGSNSSNNYDLFLAKYTNMGNLLWVYSAGDAGTEEGVKVIVDSDLNVHFTATSNSATQPSDWNILFGATDTAYYTSRGSYDFILSKYSQCYVNPNAALVGNTISAFANNVTYQWVNCNVGYLAIAGATSQTFTPTASGTYACIMTKEAGCVDTSICVTIDLCVGVNHTVSLNQQTLAITSSVTGATYQWLNCNVGYIPVGGATSQTFIPTANGNYACKISKAGCVDTSTCVEITTIGIDEFSNNKLWTLFPNPATNFVVASFENNPSNIQVQIFDVVGKTLDSKVSLSKNNITINTENLSKGVYTIRFTETTTNKTIIKRFIKE